MVARRDIALALVSCGLMLPIASLSDAQTTILDDDFTGVSVDANQWEIEDAGASVVSTSGGTNLLVQNTDGGNFWGNGRGVWNKGNNLTDPLFTRPTGAAEVNAYFFGVDMNNVIQRVAFGLSSFNEFGEATGNPQTEFDLPDGDGQGERLSYSFWLRPDDSFFGNFARSKTVNQHTAATTGLGEHEWALDGSLRDFRIRVTPDDVEWYLRTTSTGNVNDPWLLVRDAFDTGNSQAYDGNETGGRDKFRIFVHGASAGADGGVSWVDSDLEIDRILVTTTAADADFDSDGKVNGNDFLIWQGGLGTDAGSGNVAPLSAGNANGDQFVNSLDLDIWEDQFGQGVGPLTGLSIVPEPSSCLLAGFAMLILLNHRSDRKIKR
jgi:hypothetical protein